MTHDRPASSEDTFLETSRAFIADHGEEFGHRFGTAAAVPPGPKDWGVALTHDGPDLITCTGCTTTFAPRPADGQWRALWESGWRWLGTGLFSCPACPPLVVTDEEGRHLPGPALRRPGPHNNPALPPQLRAALARMGQRGNVVEITNTTPTNPGIEPNRTSHDQG